MCAVGQRKKLGLESESESNQKLYWITELELELNRYKNKVEQLEAANSMLKHNMYNLSDLQSKLMASKEELLRIKNECRLNFKNFEIGRASCRERVTSPV